MCSTVARAILNEQIETFLCYSFSFVLEEIMNILKKKKKQKKARFLFTVAPKIIVRSQIWAISAP